MLNVLEFKEEYRAGRPPRDKVLVAPKGVAGQGTRTWHYVSKIRPPETDDEVVKDSLSYRDMQAKWSVIGPLYDAWKKNEAVPESGTPLAAWAGVTSDQAKMLKALGIRTVEDVQAMRDKDFERVNWPGARKLPEMARAYLEGAEATEKDAKMAEMEEKMAAMEALLEEAMSAKAPDENKPKRGRPKKTEEKVDDE